MDAVSFTDGRWSAGNPQVAGALDHVLWLASGVFDGARGFDGVIPDLDLHCRRLIRSAVAMGLQPTLSAEQIQDLVLDGAKRLPRDMELYIRPMFWAAEGWAVPDPGSTRFALVLHHAPLPSPEGFTACLSHIRRPLPETAPTDAKAACLYPATARALRTARAAGFNNAVVLDPLGNVAEFATANLFMVKDGAAFTPLPNGTFLDGITKQRVTALLRADGVSVTETTLRYADLETADELFATGNHGKVMALRRLGQRDLEIGPVTRRARSLYWDFAHSTRLDAATAAALS